MTFTREQCENILKRSLSDLDASISEEPAAGPACVALKNHLRAALQISQDTANDDRAMAIMVSAFRSTATNIAIRVSVQSAMEGAAKHAGHWAAGRADVHDRRLKDVQSSLESFTCAFLDLPAPEPAIQCDHPIRSGLRLVDLEVAHG
jgi:2-oxoglutarate dehydrogenase complex dehydrogenase (E1) component-like enzyme